MLIYRKWAKGAEGLETVKVGGVTLTWLSGGVTNLDGGAMFGVVPKGMWSKKYPSNERKHIK